MMQRYVGEFNNNLAVLLNTLERLVAAEETKAHVDRIKRRISAAKQISGDDYILSKSAKHLIDIRTEIMAPRASFIEYCTNYTPAASNKEDLDLMLLLREEVLQKLTENEVDFIQKHVRRLLKSSIEYALAVEAGKHN